MTVLMGHFDGQRVILDGPIPKGIRPNTPVKVMVEARAARRVPSLARAGKLPTLSTLKAQLKAGSGSSLAKAQANATKLIGRPRI